MNPRRRTLSILLLVLAVLAAGLWLVAGIPIADARAAWRSGHDAQAIAIAGKWSALHVRTTEFEQLLAAAWLTSHRPDRARPYLDTLAHRSIWLSAIPKDEVARRLFAAHAYADFLAYDSAVHERDVPAVALYRSAAQAALGRIDEAQRSFAAIDRSKADQKPYAALQSAIDQRRRGRIDAVFDRNGTVIATIENGQLIGAADFAPLINASGGEWSIGAHLPQLGSNDTIETTLDPAMQRAALEALGTFRGSIVVIDPRTNEVLAIASNARENLALGQQYEPGSVVKVLTGLNALRSGLDVQSMFPYDCKGDLLIDGRHFGDWVPSGHGQLPDLSHALAVSCNIAFADIGLRLGSDKLQTFMTSAGFDGQTDLGLFQLPLGKNVGRVFNRYETALYAIGLEHESITTFHLAMLASMMANRGVLTTPRLVRSRHSMLGEVTAPGPRQASVRIAPVAAAETMIAAMQEVVNDPRGTGRRAPVAGVPMALKTGTAGKRENGYQALIMAFAPVASPRIAFGIIAEDAGPAEIAGAKIAHDFLEKWRAAALGGSR